MIGKQLSALLQILRSNGVTHYQTPDLTLQLGPPAPPKRAPIAIEVSPEALAAEQQADDDDDEGDPRFLLERLTKKHLSGTKADPRKNLRTA